MKHYDITFITKEPVDSAQGKEQKGSLVKADIESFGGKILSESKLGQKTFTYPIEKEKSGFYTTYIFEMDPLKIQDLNRKLRMEEEVLRHLIISIKPSEEMASMETPIKATKEEPSNELAVETKTTEIMPEPEKAIEEAPKVSLDEAPDKEINEPEETAKPKSKKKETKEEKNEEAKETAKPKKKAVEKKAEEKDAKPKKAEKPTKPEIEPVDEEERLEALDKKLEELLKD